MPLENRRLTPLQPAPVPVLIEAASEDMANQVIERAGAHPHDDTDKRLIEDFQITR